MSQPQNTLPQEMTIAIPGMKSFTLHRNLGANRSYYCNLWQQQAAEVLKFFEEKGIQAQHIVGQLTTHIWVEASEAMQKLYPLSEEHAAVAPVTTDTIKVRIPMNAPHRPVEISLSKLPSSQQGSFSYDFSDEDGSQLIAKGFIRLLAKNDITRVTKHLPSSGKGEQGSEYIASITIVGPEVDKLRVLSAEQEAAAQRINQSGAEEDKERS